MMMMIIIIIIIIITIEGTEQSYRSASSQAVLARASGKSSLVIR